MRDRRLLSLLLSAMVVGLLPCQRQAPPVADAAELAPQLARSALADFVCLADDGAETVAVGRGWRASFSANGVEMRPAQPRTAAQAAPLTLELRGVRRGDGPLMAAGACAARRVDRAQRRVEFVRDGVVERYEARPEGLMQSFWFDARPSGQGDLVVALAITTGLPLCASSAQELRWGLDGGPAVAMREVAGIDASGRRIAGSMRWQDGQVELRLPGAFVDEAHYPLVLDPLIGPPADALANYDIDFPDVAFEPFSDSYCMVWTMYSGGGQSDVVGALFRASDRQLATAFVVQQQGDEDQARVCGIAGMGVYVLVWTNLPPGGSQLQIATMALEPTQLQASSVYVIAGPGPVGAPQLSGESSVYDDDCLVVWDDDSQGILGASLQVNPDMSMGMTPPLLLAAGADVGEATISKHGGDAGVHVVAWADRPRGMPGWIRAQVVDHDMNPMGQPAWLHSGAMDAAWPALDGDGLLFFAVWEEQEAAIPAATDVRGRTFTVSQAGFTSLSPAFDVAAFGGDVDGWPDVACFGDRFGVVYQSGSLQQPFVDDAYFRVFTRQGQPIGPEHRLDVATRGNYAYEHAPRITTRFCGDSSTVRDDGIVVFADQDNRTAESDIGLQAVEAMGAGGGATDLGGGCGPAGLCSVRGACALGNAGFAIDLHGAPPLAVPVLIVGFAARPLLSCGVCTIADPHLFQFAPSTNGAASAALPLPGDPVFVGLALDLQWAEFQVAYVGCPLAPGVAATNRVRAVIGL